MADDDGLQKLLSSSNGMSPVEFVSVKLGIFKRQISDDFGFRDDLLIDSNGRCRVF